MGVINVLDFQVANLIAAGEVVDRPASAVKELLENAIDAGADSITLEIKNGGVAFIRVTDNGSGMSREDVQLCVLRHATSKIKTALDLDGITTLGFRGEAMAAICSVSHMRIMTKRECDEVGTLFETACGEMISLEEAACQNGTTVIVEELFANIPARRKFLKTDASEAMAVTAVAEKIALSHPSLALKYIMDGKIRFSTSGDGRLLNTIYAVLGRDFAKKLAPVDTLTDGISVVGFIGTPENIRSNRNYQNFFINGRYVKSKTASAALEQAFRSYIPSDKFPSCVLYIELHPALIDVNVHPTKLEIKFVNERQVFDAIYCAVRGALSERITRPELSLERSYASSDDLRSSEDYKPEYNEHKEEPIANPVSTVPDVEFTEVPAAPEQTLPPPERRAETLTQTISAPEEAQKIAKELYERLGIFENPERVSALAQTSEPEVETARDECAENVGEYLSETPFYRIAGELFDTYVIVQLTDRMIIVDKHAAHERIIYEELRRGILGAKVTSQQLLLPIEIKLDGREYAALYEYRDEFCKIGFCCDWNERESAVSVTGVPGDIGRISIPDMVTTLAGALADGTGTVAATREGICERALYSASCKAAIKGGEVDSEEHIRWIIERLLRYPNIKYCPHGRPVAFELTRSMIEHRFGRT